MKLEFRYSDSPTIFLDEIEKKFVISSGVNQQIKKIIFIDENFNNFCEHQGISKKKYEIISVIVFLDEIFLAYGGNKYIRYRFMDLLNEKKHIFKNIVVQDFNSTLTFFDVYYFLELQKHQNENIEILYKFHKTDKPFEIYKTEL